MVRFNLASYLIYEADHTMNIYKISMMEISLVFVSNFRTTSKFNADERLERNLTQ